MKKIIKRDMCIIGAGPAGLAAGLFAARRGLKTCIVAKDIGGQALAAPIENYPGIIRISGCDFAQTAWKQAQTYGCELCVDEAIGIEHTANFFTVHTVQKRAIRASAIILACGKSPKSLGVPGEQELFGKGVEYFHDDVSAYRGLHIAVAGGGASAVQSACVLSDYAAAVYLVHRRDSLSAEAADIAALGTKKNVHLLFYSSISRIEGSTCVEAVNIRHRETGEMTRVAVDRVLMCIGLELNLSFLGDLVKKDEKGRILITQENETSCPGVFAAGDATALSFHQVVISAGEGAKAALSAYRLLQERRGARSMLMDWKHA